MRGVFAGKPALLFSSGINSAEIWPKYKFQKHLLLWVIKTMGQYLWRFRVYKLEINICNLQHYRLWKLTRQWLSKVKCPQWVVLVGVYHFHKIFITKYVLMKGDYGKSGQKALSGKTFHFKLTMHIEEIFYNLFLAALYTELPQK